MNLCINDFEGPLDLLLHLVRTAKMDIYEIDTKYIIDKYLEFINSLPQNDLDEASEYLVMASELIHLKSRLLLNIPDDSNENDEFIINSEEDLKNKLIEYEKYQNVTNIFKDLEEKRNEFFTKVPENINEYKDYHQKLEGQLNPNILQQALIELQKRMFYQKPLNTRIAHKEISIEERKQYIRDFLNARKKVRFMELFEDYNKDIIVATFLSILDLCKNNEVNIDQREIFGDIFIEKVNNE